jgi:hypothetical protein
MMQQQLQHLLLPMLPLRQSMLLMQQPMLQTSLLKLLTQQQLPLKRHVMPLMPQPLLLRLLQRTLQI